MRQPVQIGISSKMSRLYARVYNFVGTSTLRLSIHSSYTSLYFSEMGFGLKEEEICSKIMCPHTQGFGEEAVTVSNILTV